MTLSAPRSSCDECRRRKVKCGGLTPEPCTRCLRESIPCVYSSRKRLGRPRKRLRTENESTSDDLAWIDAQPAMQMHDNIEYDQAGSVLDQNDEKSRAEVRPQAWDWQDAPEVIYEQVPQINHDEEHGHLDISMDQLDPALFVDPTLNPMEQVLLPPKPSCNCLAAYYLAAAELPTTSSLGFPAALPPLRSAMKTAQELLDCQICMQEVASFKQNILTLTSLLSSIATGFDKLMRGIDTDADTAGVNGSKLRFLWGDQSLVNMHRHTGTDDCPMKMDLPLDPAEWRVLTKRIVKGSIVKNSDGQRTLEGLIDGTEQRQRIWHNSWVAIAEYENHHQGCQTEDCAMLRLIKDLRRQISQINT